ncbi:MAG: radical SAM protein [Candidatus Altiarchaeota archaeon]|nr:radical SAM protein [Candidatus Altiarchaeota archaeon]
MKSVYLEILLKCPLNCIFCSQGLRERTGPEDSKKMKELIKTYSTQGFGKLLITGGEPLLHPDVIEFVKYAKDLGFGDVALQTGGTLFTKDVAKKLKDAGLGQAIFSVHSHVPETVDLVMKGKGILEKQLAGIKNAINEGLDVNITTLVIQNNYLELPEFFKFMTKEYPQINHYTINYVDAIGSSKNNKDVVPKYSDAELSVNQSFAILTNAKKSFRFERIPLCYALEFAENNTELRRIITDEQNKVNRSIESISYDKKYFEVEYEKGEACEACTLNPICPGVDKDYVKIHGVREIYPIFVDPLRIIERSGAD